jgi:hypothetical protein
VLYRLYYGKELPEQLAPHLERLVGKADSFLAAHFPGGCFCKLSTRSAKDSMWNWQGWAGQEERRALLEHLASRGITRLEAITPEFTTEVYRWLLDSQRSRLRVCSGRQFVELFSSSDRILTDLRDLAALQGHQFESCSWQECELTHVWGREWADITFEEEFRCFFKGLVLTAITQYDQYCYFPGVALNRAAIQGAVELFFERVAPLLAGCGLQQGVMDLVVRHRGSAPY